MTDFLLELRSEEIPARMQDRAREDLAKLFAAEIARAGLAATAVETYATPRRLALIARGLPQATEAVSEEVKGPKAYAPPQALEGFLRKTGLTRDQLVERDGVLFAVTERSGRATAEVLAEAIPAIVRAFPWPKSMRWGAASASTESLRWVRPLHGIVALFGEAIVPCEVAGIVSGATTYGHRFHHPGPITIGSAADYAVKLHAAHVVVDQAERRDLIRARATALAAEAGLTLVEDEGLVAENAGLTEWPVPLLGRFDEAFLQVPPEVIQLTARVNQKYFVCRIPPRNGEGGGAASSDEPGAHRSSEAGSQGEPWPQAGGGAATGASGEVGMLANAFVCTANIEATDGGAKIVEGNRKVLAARLADARFFYDTDLRVPLEEQAKKLDKIVFHEKLGTVADKVDRVARLAKWLVEEGIVGPNTSPARGGGPLGDSRVVEGQPSSASPVAAPPPSADADGPPPRSGEDLATLAERAARLAKADLVTGMVGEFPELQGLMGGYYAAAQGEHPAVAAAIRDHYKPVGQGDEVPTDPVTVAVSLADKLDTLVGFFLEDLLPTGSRDPFALRRAALSVLMLIGTCKLRLPLKHVLNYQVRAFDLPRIQGIVPKLRAPVADLILEMLATDDPHFAETAVAEANATRDAQVAKILERALIARNKLLDFFADRLKVQQREAGVRHDLIDAVFALGGEDDLVRLLARVRALQAFVGTEDGANLLAGYKRAANILKKEAYSPSPLVGEGRGPLASASGKGEGEAASATPASPPHPSAAAPLPPSPARGEGQKTLSYTPEPAEDALRAALESAEPAAHQAVADEDFERAMAALATLRAPIDAFFDTVTVNDPDADKRLTRLALLDRVRAAVHQVADFSRIEG